MNFSSVHNLGNRKLKPYKAEVPENRTQDQENTWKLVASLGARKSQGKRQNQTINFTQFPEEH